VDFVQDVPVQDIERLKNTPSLRVTTGPENRTIFFGMDVGSKDLKGDNVEGKNPLADKRVRQAMNTALNRQAIQRVVMRGQSVPTGVIMPPFVNGWTPELDKAPAPDVNRAKALLKEAGYENGFQITMHCPNDRYVNDEGICQAVVGMLGQAGIKVNLVSQSKTIHFPLITKDPTETDFFLYGWGVRPSTPSTCSPISTTRARVSSAPTTAPATAIPSSTRRSRALRPRSIPRSATPRSRRSGAKLPDEGTTSPSQATRARLRDRTTWTSRWIPETSPS
jgi:ABC-type transport system substrate-binding protein